MKVDFALDAGIEAGYFQPGQTIGGQVKIYRVAMRTAPTVTATLQGTISAIPQITINSLQDAKTQTLFSVSQHVKLNSSLPAIPTSSYSLLPAYQGSFQLAFPCTSKCCPCQLPPTLDMKSSSLHCRVEYTISLSIAYKTSYHLRRTKTIHRPLRFRSAPTITSTPSSAKGSIPMSRLFPQVLAAAPDALPPYSPLVEMDVSLPNPPIFTRGSPTPIALAILVPPELVQHEAVFLRSLSAYLRSSAEFSVGNLKGTCEHAALFWSSNGKIPLKSARNELDSGIWGSCVVTRTQPSCTSCKLSLTHTLEVCAGTSRGDGDEIQLIKLSLGVLVMDPPPNYTSA